MSKENIKEFCHQHQIRVLDTNKRASKYHKVNINYFRDPMDFNRVYETVVNDSEPLYTVEIAESELERVADFESEVFNNMKKHGHYRMFEILMEQKEREEYLRNKYPAVKKAYEHYSLMLKLAESGEL
jgi:predicted subunit of tRNA(5-methylaminomethyl-2-thiouridylate) methyltransferase